MRIGGVLLIVVGLLLVSGLWEHLTEGIHNPGSSGGAELLNGTI